MTHDKKTRLLHRLLAAGVILQLLLSLVMVHPSPSHAGNFFFTIHEFLGLAVAAVLVAHWAYMLPKYRATPYYLFPWTKAEDRAALIADAKATLESLRARKLPESDVPTPLVGAVQGIGLIAASAMAVTGVLMFLFAGPDGLGLIGGLAKGIHELVAPVLWTYLIIHVAAGVLHQAFGAPLLSQMFINKD
ncbi:cytochrome b/b6 domain-containing protein [Phaeospirillum tilakii]|uniref:Cytochrome b/b6 domain-containing protein n=1 Tax=Phaeospirillum tilakii TaxID=741673 RepID=A0ABW5CBG1_9PROT